MIERVSSETDRRSIIVRLTPKGERLFQRVFPAHISYMKPYFERALTARQMTDLRNLLLGLKKSFVEQ